MERYNLVLMTKRIYQSNLSLFTLKTLRDILDIENEATLFSAVKRLLEVGDPVERLVMRFHPLSSIHTFMIAGMVGASMRFGVLRYYGS